MARVSGICGRARDIPLRCANERAFVEYCYYYGASSAEQQARYGQKFGNVSLRQGHSRYTAFAAHKTDISI